MGYNVRFPSIPGTELPAQVAQIKSYLYQHAEQMQYILDDLTKDRNTAEVDTKRQNNSFGGTYARTKDVPGNTLTVKTSGSERQVFHIFGALTGGVLHGYAIASKSSSPVWEGTSGVTLSFANDTLTITFPETVNDYVTVISNRRFTF